MMAQATVQRGFTNLITGYGGVAVAQDYAAALLGLALNTDYGAFGADITQSMARLENQPARKGQSVRLSYSKLVTPTNTNLTLAAYRYSSKGYLGLADAMALRDAGSGGPDPLLQGIQRARLQLTLNQTLPPGYGSFYLTGSTQNYWNRNGNDVQFQLGYNNNFRQFNYGVSASRQYDVTSKRWDNRVMLNLSVPLGKSPRAPFSTTSLQFGSEGSVNALQSVTGTAGKDNNFSYGLDVGYSNGDSAGRSTTSVGANASYIAPMATFTGSASKSNTYSQVGVGISGGVVAYGGGVVFTPSMGETLAIIEANDAAGARIPNANGLRLDSSGKAVVSNLTPFSLNSVEVDPTGLPLSVELAATEQRVAPTSGAIVPVKFATVSKGRAVMISTQAKGNKELPFGAEVLNEEGRKVGTVGQAGRVVVNGLQADSGSLTVRLGQKADEVCTLKYALPARGKESRLPFDVIDGTCE